MKVLYTFILSMIFGAATLQSAAFEKEVSSATTKLVISSDKPLGEGYNTLHLILLQKEELMEKAQLSVKVFMPAMPGMPAMESREEAKEVGKGRYELNVNFPMRGTWQMHIFISPPSGKKMRLKTSLDF